jgi:hypothetical protein
VPLAAEFDEENPNVEIRNSKQAQSSNFEKASQLKILSREDGEGFLNVGGTLVSR